MFAECRSDHVAFLSDFEHCTYCIPQRVPSNMIEQFFLSFQGSDHLQESYRFSKFGQSIFRHLLVGYDDACATGRMKNDTDNQRPDRNIAVFEALTPSLRLHRSSLPCWENKKYDF